MTVEEKIDIEETTEQIEDFEGREKDAESWVAEATEELGAAKSNLEEVEGVLADLREQLEHLQNEVA